MALFGHEREIAGFDGKEWYKGVLWGVVCFAVRHTYMAIKAFLGESFSEDGNK